MTYDLLLTNETTSYPSYIGSNFGIAISSAAGYITGYYSSGSNTTDDIDFDNLTPVEFFYYILYKFMYMADGLGVTDQFNSITYGSSTTVDDFVNDNSGQFTSGTDSSGDTYTTYTDSLGGVYKYTYTLSDSIYTPSSLTYTIES